LFVDAGRKPIWHGSTKFVVQLTPSLKRDDGFPTQDAAKIAGREDAKKMRNSRQPDTQDVGRIMVGQNAEKATRY
jgi:hypothetical protein